MYKTPTKAGVVQVVDATGMRLKLVADDGQMFYFDIASRKFVAP